jgi:hypothetical protein
VTNNMMLLIRRLIMTGVLSAVQDVPGALRLIKSAPPTLPRLRSRRPSPE